MCETVYTPTKTDQTGAPWMVHTWKRTIVTKRILHFVLVNSKWWQFAPSCRHWWTGKRWFLPRKMSKLPQVIAKLAMLQLQEHRKPAKNVWNRIFDVNKDTLPATIPLCRLQHYETSTAIKSGEPSAFLPAMTGSLASFRVDKPR